MTRRRGGKGVQHGCLGAGERGGEDLCNEVSRYRSEIFKFRKALTLRAAGSAAFQALSQRAAVNYKYSPMPKYKGGFNRDKGDTGDKNQVNVNKDKRDIRDKSTPSGSVSNNLYPSLSSPSSLLNN